MRFSTVNPHSTANTKVSETRYIDNVDKGGATQEVRNDRALSVSNRVQNKLTGECGSPLQIMSG